MKRESNNDTGSLFECFESQDNVIDFSPAIRDLTFAADRRPFSNLEWSDVANILDENARDWSHSIRDIRTVGDVVIVTAAITVDGITREGIGMATALTPSNIQEAENEASKRAAVKFNNFRKPSISEPVLVTPTDPVEPPNAVLNVTFSDPVARTVGDMITSRQLSLIRSLARESEFDAQQECSRLKKCSVIELSRNAAADLIEHLQMLRSRGSQGQKIGSRRTG